MKNIFLIAALAVLVFAQPSFAADAKAPAKEAGLGPIDKNKDGFVTKDEADLEAKEQFKGFDVDGDKKITKEEYTSGIYKINKKPPASEQKTAIDRSISARFTMQDENKDGSISETEFLSESTRRHKTMDLNGDGKVTQAELDQLKVKMRERIKMLMEKNKAAASAKAKPSPETSKKQ